MIAITKKSKMCIYASASVYLSVSPSLSQCPYRLFVLALEPSNIKIKHTKKKKIKTSEQNKRTTKRIINKYICYRV